MAKNRSRRKVKKNRPHQKMKPRRYWEYTIDLPDKKGLVMEVELPVQWAVITKNRRGEWGVVANHVHKEDAEQWRNWAAKKFKEFFDFKVVGVECREVDK